MTSQTKGGKIENSILQVSTSVNCLIYLWSSRLYKPKIKKMNQERNLKKIQNNVCRKEEKKKQMLTKSWILRNLIVGIYRLEPTFSPRLIVNIHLDICPRLSFSFVFSLYIFLSLVYPSHSFFLVSILSPLPRSLTMSFIQSLIHSFFRSTFSLSYARTYCNLLPDICRCLRLSFCYFLLTSRLFLSLFSSQFLHVISLLYLPSPLPTIINILSSIYSPSSFHPLSPTDSLIIHRFSPSSSYSVFSSLL